MQPNCIEKVLKMVKAKLAEKRAADADKFVASRPFKSEKSMEEELQEETQEKSFDDSSPSDVSFLWQIYRWVSFRFMIRCFSSSCIDRSQIS